MNYVVLTILSAILPGPRTQYVNPFVGKDAHGRTFPGAGSPGFLFIDEIRIQ